ncbi:MAG: ABC transporter ATP-binding protein, partial [Edaphobacter sp.]
MKRIWRLLLYVRPYALYSLLSVALMAIVGAMAAFRILLIKPIFENVLSPQASSNILVFPVPHLGWTLNLNFLVPSHFHNAWSVVAYALVVSALVKSVCDYAGTYLANYA